MKAREVVKEQQKANKLLSDCAAAPFERALSMFNLSFKQSSKNYHKNFGEIVCFSLFYDSKILISTETSSFRRSFMFK